MNMTKQTSESTRYIIQVGNNRFRRETWDNLKNICSIENTPMADEIWCALDVHVRGYANENEVLGKGANMVPAPDFSLPESDNIFDKMVDTMVADAAEKEVEEVVNEPSGEKRRVASSDMFGHYKAQQ